ncbi:MAG: hypothetical protein IJ524_09575 [Bacteroidales bacterium]|nr:hypothetical protein [Bacteroidales bacterium]
MRDKKEYMAPQLTVVSFKSERGYAGSVDLLFWLAIQNSSSEQMEAYETGNGWTEGNTTFWN